MSLREFARYRSRSHEKKRPDRSRSESSSPSTSSSCERRRKKRKHLKKAERKDRHTKKHKKDVKHKRKKRTRSESSSSSDSDNFEKRKKKSKHKLERKKKKKKKKKSTKEKQVESKDNLCQPKEIESSSKLEPEINEVQGPAVNEMDKQPHKRSMAPMTKAEYEKQQSKIRRVYDPETGRNRLIKGDGEVIEEIVSYDRHKLINQMATHGDGVLFQANQQKEMFS